MSIVSTIVEVTKKAATRPYETKTPLTRRKRNIAIVQVNVDSSAGDKITSQ